jgi:hypothetical protein
MIASFARQTVTRLRAAETTDRYGNTDRDDWTAPDTLDVSPVTVEPIAGSETFDSAGGRLHTRWLLHADADADIATGDRIDWQGVTYDIDGAVQIFSSPSGRLKHVEVMLRWQGTADA